MLFLSHRYCLKCVSKVKERVAPTPPLAPYHHHNVNDLCITYTHRTNTHVCTPCIFCHTYSIYVRLRHTYELSVYYHKGRTFALVLYHHPHRSSPFLQMYKVYVNIAMSWMIHFTGPEIRVFYVFVLSGKGRRGSNVRSREGDLVGPVIYVVKSRLTMVMVLSS